MNKLFRNIDLLQDQNKIRILMDNTRSNLWILRHFRHLNILNKKICYQVNNGLRQRKNTKYPLRWMKKKFKNTTEFLDYLETKPYDIIYLEFEFTNAWKIKEQSNAFLNIYTNSLFECNELMKKLIEISGENK